MKRGGPLRRVTPLRQQSRKRQRDAVKRRALVEELIERYPRCQRCQFRPSVDLHEIKRRSQGGDFLNAAEIAVLCRECHDWIGNNVLAARDEGWVRWSYEDVEPRNEESA